MTLKENRAMAVGKFVFQVFLIVMLQYEVQATCPASCKCDFNDFLVESRSICVMGDSTVNVTWSQKITQYILTVTCQGTNISCENLPQFDVNLDKAKVIVKDCIPSVLKCINRMYNSTSTIMTLDVIKLPGQYKAEDFKGFNGVHLLYIELKDTDKEIPAEVINALPSLNQVTIVGGNLTLHSNVFNQSKINFFQLEYNNIRSIPSDAFNGLSNLMEFSIEGNNIEELNNNAFRGLNKLDSLYISYLKIPALDSKVFLAPKKLTSLSLTNTQIQNIPSDFMKGFNKLHMLQIKQNEMDMTLGSEVFARLPISIIDIELSDCRIRSLPDSLFKRSSHLRGITMDNNMIEKLPPRIFSDLYTLRSISLKNNSIKTLSKEIFAETKKIETIDLSQNNIGIVSRDLFAANLDLEVLNLNDNNISYIDLNTFNGMNLRKLDLSSNKLQNITFGDRVLWQTRHLNLSYNQISQIEHWFMKINRLIHLDLTHNNITVIKESDIHSFKSRTFVDLRHNQISKLIKEKSDIKLLAPKNKIDIYLSNNPIECNCLTIKLLKEWKEHNILADFYDITCENIGKLSAITDKEASLLCNKENALIGLIGSSTVGTLILILLIISIYSRRKRLSNYISNILHGNTENLTPYEIRQDSLKKYDLFISFAYKDGEFVTDKLLAKLENDFAQKVCVHYRDWIVGDMIPDQIVQSVESSRMTIIILTEHFLVSEWSYLEFRTAHNLSIQEGKPRVIVILLNKDILQNINLSDDLKSYIAVNNYLLWDEDNFWKKLQEMLPKGQINQKDGKKLQNSLKM